MWIFTFSFMDCDQEILFILGFNFYLQTLASYLQAEACVSSAFATGEGLNVDLKLERILLILDFCPGMQLRVALVYIFCLRSKKF